MKYPSGGSVNVCSKEYGDLHGSKRVSSSESHLSLMRRVAERREVMYGGVMV